LRSRCRGSRYSERRLQRLRQIVLNLVGNALKFTEKGEVKVSVQTESGEAKGPNLHFTVSDTGIGIPPEKHSHIFKAFSQADSSTTRKFGGTGLGLTISTRLVEMMGGKNVGGKRGGQGIAVPFHAADAAGGSASRSRVSGQSLQTLQGVKVLVVDDSATNRRIMQGILSRWGMNVTLAESGNQALEELSAAQTAATPYALLFTDLQMPEMDGFSLVEKNSRAKRVVRGRHHDVQFGGQTRRRGALRGAWRVRLLVETRAAIGIAGSHSPRAQRGDQKVPLPLVTRYTLQTRPPPGLAAHLGCGR